MKALIAKGSRKISAIIIDDSTVFIPQDYNPGDIFGSVVWDQLPTGVPISHIRVSLISWLRLTEKVHQKLIEIGQPEIARQILPRGGCNGDV